MGTKVQYACVLMKMGLLITVPLVVIAVALQVAYSYGLPPGLVAIICLPYVIYSLVRGR